MSKLALFGGTPIFAKGKTLEDPWPETRPEDLEAVQKVFESGQFLGIHHPEIEALEKEVADYFDVDYVLAMGSGTASLHAAVAAAGVKPGSRIVAMSFCEPRS